MATAYKSKFTGEQIDNSVETVVSNTATDGQVLTANGTGGATWQDVKGTEVVANPVLAGTESDLTGLEVAGTKYKVPTGGGTEVVANPSLAGTESDLTGLEVAGIKYTVPSGGGVSIGAGFNLTIQDSYASGLEGDIFILGKNPDGVFGWHKQSIFSAWVTYTNVIMFQNTTTKNGLSIRTANAVLNTRTNSYMPTGLIGNGTNQYTLFILNKDTELHGEE